MDVANLILESYQKFGFITAETIDSMRNAQRLKVVQVWRHAWLGITYFKMNTILVYKLQIESLLRDFEKKARKENAALKLSA